MDTSTTAVSPELHGAALVRAILDRKVAERTAEMHALQERLGAHPLRSVIAEKLDDFITQCDADLESWATLDMTAIREYGLTDVDTVDQITRRAEALRARVDQSRHNLAAVEDRLARMELGTFLLRGHELEGEFQDWESVPGAAWTEYRAIQDLWDQWEKQSIGE